MNLLELAAPIGAVTAHTAVARWIAAVAFLSLLAVLSWGLLRARKRLRYEEADAVVEAEFRRLEREASR